MAVPIDTSSIVEDFEDFFSAKYQKDIDKFKSLYPDKKSFYFSYKELDKFNPDLSDRLRGPRHDSRGGKGSAHRPSGRGQG